MDSKATKYDSQYKEKLYRLYKYKYGNQSFDLIISSDDNAFNFLREYHEDLFPDTPIVFCGVNNLEAPALIDPDEFTGIIELQSIKETIDIGLQLHPGTRQIVFVVDNTPTGEYLWNQIQEVFKYYEDVRMTRIDESLSLEQIEDDVSKLFDDTIVLFVTYNRDKSGKYYSYREACARVSKASARPMYGYSVLVLPYGIVGGKLFGGFYHGQVAAEMGQRILMGEKVADIDVLTEPQTQYMFNYEQLQRWGIKESDLPEDSIIVDQPYSFYEENKISIWCVIALIALQMLIIIILVINISNRKKAEGALAILVKQQAELVKFGQVALSEHSLDALFGEAVVLVSRTFGTRYAKILEHRTEEGILFLRTGVGWKEGWVGHKSVPDGTDSQGGYTLVRTKSVISQDIRHEKRFSPPALLSEHNVVCGLTVAIPGENRPFGILGTHHDQPHPFSKDDAHFMEALANVLAAAIQRKRAEEELKESEDRFRTIFDSINDAVFIHDIETGAIINVNKTACNMYGYTHEEFRRLDVETISMGEAPYTGEDAIGWMKKAVSGEPQVFEWMGKHRSGHLFWVEVSMKSAVVGGCDRLLVVVRDISERKRLEERAVHLNLVLLAIRNVNQLITKEKDRDRLLQGACNNLIETRGYHNAWIALLDTSGKLVTTAEAGLGEAFELMVERLAHGELIECGQRALVQSEVIVIDDPLSTCTDCPLVGQYDGRRAMTIRLEHEGNVYGLLSVAVPAHLAVDKEEQALLKEVTEDIAFGLHSIEMEKERKKSEKVLHQSMTDLKRSNVELEQFAYVASHDLQEPLRMVSSYVQLLSRRYSGKLDHDADDFIGYAVEGANRMQTLINDLLTFSRVGTQGKPFEMTNCETVLEEVLTNMKMAIEDSDAVITHDALPVVIGDSLQLTQLLQNLVSNGIKFRSNKPPCIHISAQRNKYEYIFSIADNGIGIEPEFFNRIFVIFQRLHGRDEYSGTGIGLSICKKIVERHGGRIWVESEPGKGAIFYFTIPVPVGDE